MVASEKIKL